MKSLFAVVKNISKRSIVVKITPFLLLVLIAFFGIGLAGSIKNAPEAKSTQSPEVLGTQSQALKGFFNVNVPTYLNDDVFIKHNAIITGSTTLNGDVTINGTKLTINGALTAPNLVYSITPGKGIGTTGTQDVTIVNNGVTSLQNQTGDLALEAGDNISIDGLKISAIIPSSTASDSFKTISDGTNSFSAGSSTDTLTLLSGTGISLTTDTTNKKITINNTTTPVVTAVGNGLNLSSGTVSVGLLSSSVGTGSTSSFSGLEISGASNELSLLQGCSDGEILKWNSITKKWECAADSGGTTGIISVDKNGTLVSNQANTLNFQNDFAVSELPVGQVNVSLDYAASHITRDNQTQTISSAWTFSNDVALSGLSSGSGSSLCLDGSNNIVTCSGTGVTSLNGISGALSIANATGVGSTVTINNASTSQKGIAQFNSTNFSASGGTVNTIQNIDNAATPTFAGLTLSNFATAGIVHSAAGGLLSAAALNLAGGVNEVTGVLPALNGGTGLNTSSSTGVPSISSGTWSVAPHLSTSLGGTGVGTFGGTNTLLYTTTADTLASLPTANNGALITNGSGAPSITTAAADQVLRANGSGVLAFGSLDLSKSATVGTSILGVANGGIGINTSSSTGIPSITSGTWSIAATLSTALGGLGADITAAGAGELLYSTGATTYGHLAAGNGGECLTSGGAGIPVWTSCAGATGIITYFDQAGGALSPKNSTVDFLIGGSSTDSAKFAVLGVNNARGQQTATLSGNLVLDSAGSLQTTNNQTLTIGGGTTGNIQVSPNNGSGILSLNLASTNGLSVNGTPGLNISGTAQCVTTTNGIVTGTGVCQLGTEQWVAASGALYPGNPTFDLLIGGTSTQSAKFAFINNSGGIPIASVSAGLLGSTYITADGNIATTQNQNLTLGGAETGNITLSPNGGNGTVNSTGNLNLSNGKEYFINGTSALNGTTLGSNVVNSSLTSVGTLTTGTWNATAIGAQYGGTGLDTHLSTGVPSISAGTWSVNATLPNSLGGTGLDTSSSTGVATVGSGTWNIVNQLSTTLGGTGLSSYTAGDLLYYASGTSLSKLGIGNPGDCLTVGVSAPSWSACPGSGTGASKFNLANGALSPIIPSVDLLLGGDSTASAKFAFTGVATDSPVASISASNGNGIYLSYDGTIQTTNAQTLNLGGATTGNVNVSLSSPSSFQINGNTIFNSSRELFNVAGISTDLTPTNADTFNLGSNISNQYNNIYGKTIYQNGSAVCDTSGNCIGGTGGGLGGSGTLNYIAKFTDASHVGTSLLYDNGQALSVGNTSPVGFFHVAGNYGGNSAFIVDQLGIGSDILSASSSGTTRLTLDTSGNLDIVGGDYKINGTSVLSSTTLGTNIVNSSLTSVGTLTSGTWNATIIGAQYGGTGVGSFGGTNTLLYTTATSTLSSIATANNATLITNGSGVPSLTTANADQVLRANGSGVLAFGSLDLSKSATVGTSILSSSNGGTGIDTHLSTGVASINSGTWSVSSTLATSLGGLGADITAAGAGELLYSTGATTYGHLAAGNGGECLTSGGAGIPVWTSCAGATGINTYFDQSNGALYPKNTGVDFLIGATSTDSAKFAILNVNGTRGQQTATLSGNLVLDSAGSLQTTNNQTLTIGGDTTGNIALSPLNGSGSVFSSGTFNLAAGKTFQINGTDVLTGNSLGTGILSSSLASVGTLTTGTWNATAIGAQYGGTGLDTHLSTGVPSISSGTWSVNAQLATALGGTGQDFSSTAQGSITYFSNTGVMSALAPSGTSGWILSSNGAGQNPSWIDPGTLPSTNFWDIASGIITPQLTSTLDFTLGGSSTDSAKFAVLGVNNARGQQTATLSGNLVLDSAGSLQTTNNQTLTIGGDTTGNIVLSPLNGQGTIQLTNFSTDGGLLYTNASGVLSQTGAGIGTECLVGGATPSWSDCSGAVASSVYWMQANGALVPKNNTLDLLVGGNSTDSAKFAVLDVSNGTPTASISSGLNGNGLSFDANGNIQTTNNQTLTLGGGNTGDILISPASKLTIGGIVQGFTLGGDITGSGTPNISGLGTVSAATFQNSGAVTFGQAGQTTSINGSSVSISNLTGNGFVKTSGGTGLLSIASTVDAGTEISGYLPFANGGSVWSMNSANGTLTPVNNTLDLLVGGNSTDSAKFAILNINGARGTQTASISGNLTLDAVGRLQTTNNQTLTIGGNTTGNVILNPNGNIGIGTSSATEKLTLAGSFTQTATTPTVVGSISDGTNMNNAQGVSVVGKYAYVASQGTNSLTVIDVSNPVSPTEVGTIEDDTNLKRARQVVSSGKYAYVVGLDNALAVVDVSNPSSPKVIGATTTPYTNNQLAISGKYLYISSFYGGHLSVFDISNPSSPIQVGIGDDTGQSTSIAIYGNHAYISKTSNLYSLRIMDISDPLSPTQVGTLSSSDYGTIAVSGRFAYAIDYNSSDFDVIDVSNPASPSLVTSLNLGVTTFQSPLVIAGHYAYLQVNSYIYIIDISNPSSPVNLGRAYLGFSTSQPSSIATSGEYLYSPTGSGGGLDILDLQGSDISTANIGSIASSDINVSDNLNVANSAYINNSLNVGPGGILSQGTLTSSTSNNGLNAGVFNSDSILATLLTNNNGTGDLFTASSSGNTKFTIGNNGNITATGTLTGLTGLTSSGTITFSGFSTNGGLLYANGSGVLAQTGAGGSSECLKGGTTPTWGSCVATSPFQELNGAIVSNNSIEDFLIGGQATTSAKFAVLGVSTDTPVASLSASNGNGLSLGYDGTIQTTKNQTLTLGGSSTGNILVNPLNGAAGGYLAPAVDNVTDLGASSSARFRNLFLGPDSLHIQCTIEDGCAQELDLSQSINAATGNFEIGFNGTSANNKALLSLSQSGILAIGRTGEANGLLTFNSAGGGVGPTIGADSTGALIISGGSGDITVGATGQPTSVVYQESASLTAAAGKTLTLGGTNSGVIFNFGDGAQTGTFNLNQANATYNFGTLTYGDALRLNNGSSDVAVFSGGVTGGNAALILNQPGASTNDIFTASSSGTTKFTIGNNGDITATGALTGLTGLSSSGTITFSGFSGANNGGVIFANSSGVLSQTGAGSSDQCLLGGTTPSWGSCDASSSVNVFEVANGTARVTNTTLDLLVGGNSTDSAKFAVLNVNGTGPATATVSGNLIVMPHNGAGGRLGIGTTSPLASLGIAALDATDAINATGGNGTQTNKSGGGFSFTGGTGFSDSNDTQGGAGDGGGMTITLGNGGTYNYADGSGTFGNGGSFNLTTGDGGGGGAVQGADGGDINFTAGDGGGGGAGGNGGSITLQVGAVGTGGGGTNGTILLNPSFGNVGIGDTTPSSLFTVGNGDLFQVNSSGQIAAAAGITSSGTITFSGFTGANNGGVIYANSSGVLSQTGAGDSSQCLKGGATPGWGSCAASTPFQELSGAIVPNNSTEDLLIGGQSTSSAVFAVHVNGGTSTVNVTGGITQKPGTLSIVGSVNSATNLAGAYSVAVQGKYAYLVAASTTRLTVVDTSNPTSPTMVGSVSDANLNGGTGVAVAGNYAYVVADGISALTVVDISNPTSPTVVGNYTDATNLAGDQNVYVSGKYAYVTSYSANKLAIIDVSNPTAPKLTSVLADATNLSHAIGVYVSGKYAYVTASGSNKLTIVDVSNPSSPSLKGVVSDNTNLAGVGSVYVSGKYAYVTANGSNRITVVNVSNPASPSITGSLLDNTNMLGALNLYVAGKYAYIAGFGGNRVTTIDISNPSSPTFVSSTQDNTNLSGVTSVVIAGKYAYASSYGGNRLTVVDISGSDISTATIGNIASNDINISNNLMLGNSAYIGNGLNVGSGGILSQGGLAVDSTSFGGISAGVFNANTNLASLITNNNGTGNLFSASSSGSTKFTIGNNGNIAATGTLTGLTGLTSSGTVTFSGFTGANDGGVIYANSSGVLSQTGAGSSNQCLLGGTTPSWGSCDGSSSVNVFEVANGTARVTNTTLDLLVGGNSTASAAFAVHSNGGASTVDIKGGITQKAGNVTYAGGAIGDTNLNTAYRTYVQGNYAYIVGNTNNFLSIYDVTNPASPVVTASLGDATNFNKPSSVFVAGNYAYVTAGTGNRLAVVDVHNPSSPSTVGVATNNSLLANPQDVAVAGNYAYVASQNVNRLTVIDVSNPASPGIVGSLQDNTNLPGPIAVSIKGHYAYVAAFSGNRFTIVDISNPTSPTIAGSLGDLTNINGPRAVYVNDRYAYVVSQTTNTLAVIRVSTPTSPSIVGHVRDDTNLNLPRSVYVSGKYAYVASYNSNAITTVDVSDPTAPTVIGTLQDNSNLAGPRGIFVSGHYGYVAVSGAGNGLLAGLGIVDVSGADLASANIGNIKTNDINISNNLVLDNSAYIGNSLNVGDGGIYTSGNLSVTNSQSATVSATITNSDTGTNGDVLALKVGATTAGTNNRFLTFLNGNGVIVGKVQGNGSGGVTYATTGVDFAEYYKKEDANETFSPGDIVCLGTTGGATKCSTDTSSILGVVSDRAGFVGGSDHEGDPGYVLVGIVGQLPVAVTGNVKPGDMLSASDTPGVATASGTTNFVVGRALGSHNEQDGIGKVSATISLMYVPSFTLNSNGNISGANAPETSDIQAAEIPTQTDTSQTVVISDITNSIATISAQLSINTQKLNDFADLISTQNDKIANLQDAVDDLSNNSINNLNLQPFASNSGQFVTVSQGLLVYGTASLNDVAAQSLSIGNRLKIDDNSINVIGDTLSLQPLRQGGIDFMGGRITIDTDGNAVFNKDVSVLGTLTVNSLNVEKQPQNEISATEINASASAGITVIKAGETVRTIHSPLVRDDSLIYITPIGNTNNQVLYIASQSASLFTVKVNNTQPADIKFNYLIVNQK